MSTQNLGETYFFSEKDYFFKTVKVFGKDQKKAKMILERNQIPYEINADYNYVQFPVSAILHMKNNDLDMIISSNVVDFNGKENNIREVNIEWTTPILFEESDMQNM